MNQTLESSGSIEYIAPELEEELALIEKQLEEDVRNGTAFVANSVEEMMKILTQSTLE